MILCPDFEKGDRFFDIKDKGTADELYTLNVATSSQKMKAKELLERYEAGERDFSGVDLTKENLSGAALTYGKFSVLKEYPVGGSILQGIDLSQANLSQVRLEGVDLQGANLQGANLEKVGMAYANLTNANLSDAVLLSASLHCATLKRANLKKASLHQVTMTRTNFCDANLEKARLLECDAEYADFSRANLKNAKMENCELYCADLSGAKMRGVSLHLSSLDRAVAIATDLTGANLSQTRLREVNLTDANLRGSWGGKLDEAILYETIVSDGTVRSNERGKEEMARIVESREEFIERVQEIDLITQKDFEQRYNKGEKNFARKYIKKFRNGYGAYCNSPSFLYRCWLGIDLSGGKCRKLSLRQSSIVAYGNWRGIDLQGADLLGSYFINTDLTGANLRNASLESVNLTNTDLTGADLTGANLRYAKIIGTNFTNANLTNIKTDAQSGNLVDAKVFAYATMPDGSTRYNPTLAIGTQEFLRRYTAGERDFSSMVLHHGDLRGIELDKVDFSNAHLIGIDFSHAIFKGVQFNGAKLIHCNLRKTKLEGDNLEVGGCDLSDARFLYTDIRESKILGTITSTTFIECNFEGTEMLCGGEYDPIFYNVIMGNGKFYRSSQWYEW